jgi:antitoxin ParD1/3/4
MNVTLTDEQVRFIEQRVKTGGYRTAGEVVREALRVLMQQEANERRDYAAWRDDARRKIEEGLAQAKRGELVDGEQAFARIKKRLRSGRKQRG